MARKATPRQSHRRIEAFDAARQLLAGYEAIELPGHDQALILSAGLAQLLWCGDPERSMEGATRVLGFWLGMLEQAWGAPEAS